MKIRIKNARFEDELESFLNMLSKKKAFGIRWEEIDGEYIIAVGDEEISVYIEDRSTADINPTTAKDQLTKEIIKDIKKITKGGEHGSKRKKVR